MNCLHYKSELTEVARKQLQPQSELLNHLKNCTDCTEYLKSQTNLSDSMMLIKTEDRELPSNPGSLARLLAEVRTHPTRPAVSLFWIKIAAVFIVSSLCGFYWIYLTESRQNSAEPKALIRSENTDGYVPLTYGMAPGESLQRVRVKLPRSALNDFGITLKQARTEEVTADVIVGESGIPYAIRVVQQSN